MKTISTYFLRTKWVLTAAFLFIISYTGIAQTNYYVSTTGNDLNNGLTPATAKVTITSAVSIATDGDIINIANGTYSVTSTLNFNKSLIILGQSEAGVIIDGHTIAGGWILNPNRSNTSLSNFTVKPNSINGGYPIHVAANTGNPLPVISNISLSHITINGSKKTAFDFNGVNNLTLSYLTATNSLNGNGVQVSGCQNVHADYITTSGNLWGGVAVYVSTAFNRGSDNILIDGISSSFSETHNVYSQDESGYTNTNISVNGYDYIDQNTFFVGYKFYSPTKTKALALAPILVSEAQAIAALASQPDPKSSSSVKQISTNQFTVSAGLKIQTAINNANPGDLIYVYPGNYIESAPNSMLFNGGPYTFGLFISAAKAGISLIGVDANGIPISGYANVQANVQCNATNGFGPSGVFVEGDNITIAGLNIYLDPNGGQNKTVEVIGENFTLNACKLTDGNSLYINDWRYNTTTNISHITKYHVEGNKFEAGTSLDISDGAGFTGDVSGRAILNNHFDAAGGDWAMVSFNGSGTGVPWFVNSVGGAVITGNSFVNGQQYIRHRGTLNTSQFNWNQYWNNNSFDKAVVTLSDETSFTPRDYTYSNGTYQFNNVKRIGSVIQADISNVAQNGDLVKIGSGTYAENMIVTKGVEIRGNGEALTRIIPAVSGPACSGGSLCAGASNVFLIQANNVTIDQLTVDGDNPSLTSGKIAGGADIDARNGIITDHTLGIPFNGLNVHNVTIKNIFLRGIYASSYGTFSFDHNTVSNVQADGASIALFNFGGSGSFTNNTVNDAADGIASNWSKGTVYSGNTVTNSGSGIHTDNSGEFGAVADVIQNNLVSITNNAVSGYGIWVFAPFGSVIVKDNTVSNVDVGLMVAGQNAAATPVFSGNAVDGHGKVNTTGVYITTDLFGYGTSNVSTNFMNNTITNNTDGFYLESESGNTLSLTAHNNSISGNTNSNVTQGTGASGAGVFSADMNCNWWGTAFTSGINTSINGAGVVHASWLANGVDADGTAPGFQTAGVCAGAVSNAIVNNKTNISCYGSSNGSASISFANGIAPLSYALDGNSAIAINGSSFIINGLAPGSHTVIITDAGGNTVSVNVAITQPAPVSATITVSNADIFCNKITLTASVGTGYIWKSGSAVIGTDQQLSLGQANGDGVYSVTVINNGCSGTPASYTFNKQLLINSYTILATKEIELGENNTVATGSVGVTAASGEAQFHKNSTISSPGSFVKAKNINKDGSGIVITNPIYAAATGITLPTMYLNTANTNNLSNKDVTANSTTTVSGNYKNITLKKGSNTILTGNIFGTIRVEQGAKLSFTSTTINIDKLQVVKGPRYGYSYVRFAPDTRVLVSGSVSIGSQVYINPDNYKVTFYMGDKKSDDEKFTVKGGDTKVTANIYMPNGKLKVTGGYRYGDYGNGKGDADNDEDDDRYLGQGTNYVYMTGIFITEKVEGGGKNVVWNSFDCSAGPVALLNYTPSTTASITTEEKVTTTEEELKITVMPNPSATYFTLKLESKYSTPVNLRVMDNRGRVIDSKSTLGANSTLQIGEAYSSGTYYAELIQGTTRKVVQLVKIIN